MYSFCITLCLLLHQNSDWEIITRKKCKRKTDDISKFSAVGLLGTEKETQMGSCRHQVAFFFAIFFTLQPF